MEELTWIADRRSIGIYQNETYVPVMLFNFRVLSYISGPGTSWRGYEIKILTMDGPDFIVTIEVSFNSSDVPLFPLN